MLSYTEKVDDGGLLALWQTTESVSELLSMLYESDKLMPTITSFGSDKRRKEFLATRVMLNNVLNTEKQIAYHANGAPYLTDHSYNISIAHTGDIVTILLHPQQHVGIDVERIADKVVRVKYKFLSPKELEHLSTLNEKTHLTLLWAAKEALYKILGIETVNFVTDLQIAPFGPYLRGTMRGQELLTPQKRCFTLNYRVEPEYVIVWTVES